MNEAGQQAGAGERILLLFADAFMGPGAQRANVHAQLDDSQHRFKGNVAGQCGARSGGHI